MALQAGVDFRFHAARLPWLPGVFDYGRAGAFPGGTGNNAIFFSPFVTFDDGVDELTRDALWTPETSGGLLVAVPPDRAADYQTRCPTAVVVGEVVEGGTIQAVREGEVVALGRLVDGELSPLRVFNR